jgi:hypothetical protein
MVIAFSSVRCGTAARRWKSDDSLRVMPMVGVLGLLQCLVIAKLLDLSTLLAFNQHLPRALLRVQLEPGSVILDVIRYPVR